MSIDILLTRLDKVKRQGKGYIACCPAHDDKNPSLSLTEAEDGRILMKCWAGCDVNSVLSSINLSINDLFPEPLWKNLPLPTGFHGGNKRHEEKKLQGDIDRLETILAIAASMRKQGERLSREDIEKERAAYLELRRLRAEE